MKICFMSDLHLEFELGSGFLVHPARDPARVGILEGDPEKLKVDADLVILAGDIHTKSRGPAWAHQAFPGVPVAMLGGNHEAYNASLYAEIDRSRKEASAQGALADGTQHVTWLERETFIWASPAGERVRVIGATLWTDFALFGADQKDECVTFALRFMNDFTLIRIRDKETGETRRFHPADAARIFALSADFIRAELEKPFDGISIVATHHAPTISSVPAMYIDDLASAAYASDLEPLIREHQPDLWVHGHTHTSMDYRVGNTRVLCNPRGYWKRDLNPEFVWGKTIEISG